MNKSGFSILKDKISELNTGSFIKRKEIILDMYQILSISSIDTVLRKYEASGYLLPVISIEEGLRKGVYRKSSKIIKSELNTTYLNKEYQEYFDKANELGTDVYSNYTHMNVILSKYGGITENEVKQFKVDKIVECLSKIGILLHTKDCYISLLKKKWNLMFTNVFDLYAYQEFLPKDYLIQSKLNIH